MYDKKCHNLYGTKSRKLVYSVHNIYMFTNIFSLFFPKCIIIFTNLCFYLQNTCILDKRYYNSYKI